MPSQRLPVTVLSGFLGSGKTTLLNAVLHQQHGLRIAVIVNDMSEVNIDAQLVRNQDAALRRVGEQLVEMTNGCICYTLREDLLVEITRLAREQRFDYLLIESSGIAEPLPVAETFTFFDEQGASLADLARLDTLVTVVDAVHFLKDYESIDDLAQRGLATSPDDERSVVDLLIEQVEFANVLVISKIDLVTPDALAQLHAILQQLNPSARIIHAQHGAIDPRLVMDTGLFDLAQAEENPGWLLEPRGTHVPETEEYGISSFVYRARRPFHPQRFWECLQSDWGGVLRSKGFFWLASRPEECGVWSQAGGFGHTSPGGAWWATASEDEWPDDPSERARILADWQEPWGDRRQELVVIGIDMDRTALTAMLDACLLTDAEMAEGSVAWRAYSDPFGWWGSEQDEEAMICQNEPKPSLSH